MDLLNLLHFYYEKQLLSYLSVYLSVCLSVYRFPAFNSFTFNFARLTSTPNNQPTNQPNTNWFYWNWVSFFLLFVEHFLDSLCLFLFSFLYFLFCFFVPFFLNYNEVVSSSQPEHSRQYICLVLLIAAIKHHCHHQHHISTKILASL